MRHLTSLLLLFFFTVSFSQNVEFKGIWQQKKIDTKSKNVRATLNVDNIDIEFSTIPELNIEAIEIRSLDYQRIKTDMIYFITKYPKKDNEIRIDLNVPKTCGDIECNKGELIFKKLTDNHINTKGYIIITRPGFLTNDTLSFIINTPLFNAIPKLTHEELDENYTFNNVVLSGSLNSNEFIYGSEFKEKKLVGIVEFDLNDIEIKLKATDKMPTDFELTFLGGFYKWNEITHKHRLDEKIKPGTYEIVSHPEFTDSLGYINYIKSLTSKQLFGDIDDDKKFDHIPVTGVLNIITVSDKKMSGNFDLKLTDKECKGTIYGQFELPVLIE